MTHLCVSIFVHDVQQARRQVAQAVEAGADMVELRVDELKDVKLLAQLVAELQIGVVLTCRSASEGGHSELSDEQRLRLVCQIAPKTDRVLIDFEHRALQRIGPADIPNRLIVSFHDFSGRPPTLTSTYEQMLAGPGQIVKLAWMARSIRDNLEAFEILQSRQKPTIA
ncbi:MAG TPA: type I 3-dehydroquinate dehydratase, partial [Tepidisphaeraceae bacterium]|nr:type I 3-dehydroquinate dehydratase [Tepidisphaeraceae bacterium]